MKVLFGSIEYFEKEILSYASQKSLMNIAYEQVMEIYSDLKNELINDFICEEKIKKECLNNLNLASKKFL
jgi:hypothetical protein